MSLKRAVVLLFLLAACDPSVGSSSQELVTTYCHEPLDATNCRYVWWGAISATGFRDEMAAQSKIRRGFRIVALAATDDDRFAVFAENVPVTASSPVLWGRDAATLAKDLEGWTTREISPRVVAATGADTLSARITVVGEPRGPRRVLVSNLTQGAFDGVAAEQRADGNVLTSAAVYGAPRLLAGIFEPSTVRWDANLATSALEAEEIVNAANELGARPTLIAQSLSDAFLIAHQDDDIHGNIETFLQLSSAEVEATLSSLVSRGYVPRSVSFGRVDGDRRYTFVLEVPKAPTARVLTVTGPEIPPELGPVEDVVTHAMREHGAPTAAIALTYQGRLIMARGYTYAEPGAAITQPTSTFRTASIAKPITATTVLSLIQGNLLRLDDLVEPLVGMTHVDPRGATITVDHLLQHRGGWDRSLVGDIVFMNHFISFTIGRPLPLTLDDLITFDTSQPLQWDPGSHYAYSNYGYVLLGRIVEIVTGQGYEAYVRTNLWDQIGVPARVRSAHVVHAAEELTYRADHPYVSRSVYDNSWVPHVDGGFDLETTFPAGSWLVSAPDYARFLVALDRGDLLDEATTDLMRSGADPAHYLRGLFAYELPKGITAWGHIGRLPGTATMAYMRSDRIGVVVLFGANMFTVSPTSTFGLALDAAIRDVTVWPEEDLFPSQGITR